MNKTVNCGYINFFKFQNDYILKLTCNSKNFKFTKKSNLQDFEGKNKVKPF